MAAAIDADLVAYLDAASSFTAGTDLFEGPPPELPDNVAVITQTPGEPPGDQVMGPSLTAPGYEIPHVQLFVRHTVKATAKANADTLHALLARYFGTLPSGRVCHLVESIDGEPYTLGQDQNGRWRYVSNYRVRVARAA